MNIHYIAIGSELLNGKIRDRNTDFLAKKLAKLGLNLQRVSIVNDNEKDLFSALAVNDIDIIITSGGLGPTEDDMTKVMLAKFFNKKLEYNPACLEIVKQHYFRGGKIYDPQLFSYHHIPVDFQGIINHNGYAPGLMFQNGKQQIFATPGVPAEFQEMLGMEIIPKVLSSQDNKKHQKHVIIKTAGIPEAQIFKKLCPHLWKELENFGTVSSLPHYFGVDIGVFLEESDELSIAKKEEDILNIIQKSKIQESVWLIGEDSLAETVVKEAREKNLTIGFAESCTGGLCASLITDVSGSSAAFWGSIVSYANEVKIKSLNVAASTLKEKGAVSLETAKEMAIGAKNHIGADIVIATTGIAGPNGGSTDKPVGTVGIGIASKATNESYIYHFKGDRETLKQKFAMKALMHLLKEIRSLT